MSRFIVRLLARFWLLCLLMLAGSMLVGSILPPAPLVVIIEPEDEYNLLSVLDTRFNTAYSRHYLPAYEFWSDNNCLLTILPFPVSGNQIITMLDAASGRWREYALETDIQFTDGLLFASPSETRPLFAIALESPERTLSVAVIDAQHETVRYIPVQVDTPLQNDLLVLDWSPDSKRLILTGSATYLLDVASGETRYLTEDRELIWRWSADGRYIITTLPIMVDTVTGTRTELDRHLSLTFDAGGVAVWSPAGHGLAFQGSAEPGQNYGYVYNIDTGTLTPLVKLNTPAQQPVWSPDGKMLVYFSAVTRFLKTSVVDSRTGERIAEAETQQFNQTVWSPDSRYLLMVSLDFDGFIRLLDTHTRKMIAWQSPAGRFVASPGWFPDSRTFSFIASSDGSNSKLQIARIQGDNIEPIASYNNAGDSTRICLPEGVTP